MEEWIGILLSSTKTMHLDVFFLCCIDATDIKKVVYIYRLLRYNGSID